MMSMLKVPSRFFHTGTVKEAGYAMPRRTHRARSSVATGALLVLIPLLIVRLKQQQLSCGGSGFGCNSNYSSASSPHIPSFPNHCKI